MTKQQFDALVYAASMVSFCNLAMVSAMLDLEWKYGVVSMVFAVYFAVRTDKARRLAWGAS